jgi:cytochrome c5
MIKYKLLTAGVFFIAAAAIITACDKKVGKAPVTTPVVVNNCDTITYTKHIKGIVEANCTLSGCHDGTNGNPLLGTYDQFKDRADAGRIQARVIDETPSRMPPAPSPALTAEQKALISCWLSNGKKQ